jgi:hypothetical protein
VSPPKLPIGKKKKQKPAHNFKGEVENEIEKENRV